MSVADAPVGLAFDYDRAVWLAGPPAGTPDDEVASWVAGAWAACVSDFGLTAEAAASTYLREVLTEFATADLGCEFRFLRLRSPQDQPLTARLNVLTQAAGMKPAGVVTELLAVDDTELRPWDEEPGVEVIDETRGLSRRLWFRAHSRIDAVARYHRRVDEWGIDLILSCRLPSLTTAALALPDLDALAAAIWVVDENGARR